MKMKDFSKIFLNWLQGEEVLSSTENSRDRSRKGEAPETSLADGLFREQPVKKLERVQLKSFRIFYAVCAVLCCAALQATLLTTVANLPGFGTLSENAEPLEEEYLTQGMEETGATNIVAAIILNYRAFDTLGESFVLFTALCCVTVLLRADTKNQREHLLYRDLTGDNILRFAVSLVAPMIILYGFYVMVNGHLSPGGGFSGGAVAGAGMILLSAAFGFDVMDRIFKEKFFNTLCFCALGFYALSKTYSFFCEANGIDSHIPKGIPGTIFSGGLILPLNIAVGLVVTMTMYGMYCLFRRGCVGGASGTRNKDRPEKEKNERNGEKEKNA